MNALTGHGPHIEATTNDNCTGCAGCANACPNGAIKMRLSAQGFYQPGLDIAKCDSCGICRKACPVHALDQGAIAKAPCEEPKCYAAWTTDSETHLSSSSGGAFTEISKLVMENGGVVFGCSWNGSLEPEHVAVLDSKDLGKLRGSKYVPSNIGLTLSQALGFAKGGRQVLFSGTPCQVAALSRLLDPATRSNTVLVDFICHGVPSLRLFSSYKRWLFQGRPLGGYTFRDKSLGLQTIVATASSGRVYKRHASADPFFRLAYGYHLGLMRSCFKCRFSGMPRISDITLGDFWGAPDDMNDPKGVSVVFANSRIGETLVKKAEASGGLNLKPTELSVVVQQNPRATGGEWSFPGRWTAFMEDIACGRSFTWVYWRWYKPLRILETARSFFSGIIVWLYRRSHAKKLVMSLRKSA